MNIEQLLKQERELRDAILLNSKAQRELNVKDYEERTGLKIGDKVKFGLKKGIIANFSFSDNRVTSFSVNVLRKDGTPGRLIKINPWDLQTLEKIT